MSIKKLFDGITQDKQYSDYETEKDAFESVESSENVSEIILKQNTFVPQIDFSEANQFVKFGSAYFYYKGALTKISEYYPYDGSDAEKNKFYNSLLDVEKYIFDNEYPRTTGYINTCADGWGSRSSTVDGYGLPATQEYITFKGGPVTSSGASLVAQGPNPYSDKIHSSNVYDENIYRTAGLPADYGSGTRLSNLRANLDDGVTVEFWLKSGSMTHANTTQKQVIFDWWNNEAVSDADYGRILIELTSSKDVHGNYMRPFLVTVQSGACTTKDFVSLGTSSLAGTAAAPLGSWGHYALRMYNSASMLHTDLYVNGNLSDTAIQEPYNLSSSVGARAWPCAIDKSYSSSDTLQGWWKLNEDVSSTGNVTDSSGNGRAGEFDAAGDRPAYNTSNIPSAYIQSATNTFDGTDDAINIGTAATWNAIIGDDPGGTSKMSFSAWIRPATDTNREVINFGNDIRVYVPSDESLVFLTYWDGAAVIWTTGASAITEGEWQHIAITYDASSESAGANPVIYINGVAQSISISSGTVSSPWEAIAGSDCYIGANSGASYAFNGQLADVAVWNSILSAAEIKSIYKAASIPAAFSTFTELNSKNAMGRIGALQVSPPGIAATAGAGKLSGSLDEFRFWKVKRNAAQIAENYFVPVNGGTNTDISNTTLGVYFKFNEGIVGTTADDSIVLDYSGRLSNGVWTGYPGSSARNSGSAIVSASAASKEYLDPIIRQSNPRYLALSSSLVESGSWYDLNNNSQFLNYMPSWIIEEHENIGNQNLAIMSHIMGSYFDKLYNLTTQIPKVRQETFTTSSHRPIPFASHLPKSLGMTMPEVFIDASVREKLLDRDKTSLFESDIDDIKNLIYLNLYNNLTNIYKSKGTEKAIRNVMRCFYLDDSLFRLTTYATNNTYELRNNVVQHIDIDRSINFGSRGNTSGVVYQKQDSTNPESRGYISGSGVRSMRTALWQSYQQEDPFGFTTEASITFPHYNLLNPTSESISRNFVSCSLFGLHTVNTASADTLADPRFIANDYANFQVLAVRTKPASKNVSFLLTSSNYPYPVPTLSSSVFFNVYNEENWNLSVRLRPVGGAQTAFVTGSRSGSYEVIFRGTSTNLGSLGRNFEVSGTVNYITGTMLARAPKRIYAGARRQNITGTLLQESDVKIMNVKHWMRSLDSSSLNMHAFDGNNQGISSSYQNIAALPATSNPDGRFDLLNYNTLALQWTFENITGSNSTGNFVTVDNSSGSALIRDNYGWLGGAVGYQHSGYGHSFTGSSTKVVDNRPKNMFKFIDPENTVGTDMVQILSEDDKVFGVVETVPSYLFTIEKSMFQAVTEEMLKFFAGVVDFNNVIGNPVNRYRTRYKDMEKLREAFFRRVTTTSDVEKFVDYYKWFDDAISTIVSQLIPASADFVDDVLNTVESHVLERNKYESKYPTLEAKAPDLDTAMEGGSELPPWETASSTLPSSPRDTTKHEYFWKFVAIRSGSVEISSGNSIVDVQRDTIKNVVSSEPTLSSSLPILSKPDGTTYQRNTLASRRFQRPYKLTQGRYSVTGSTFKGGTNFGPLKNIDFTYNALRPAGPVNTDDDLFIPLNVLLAFGDDFEKLKNVNDPPNIPSGKVKRFVKVTHGRNWEDGLGYSNVSSKVAFPFNIISSSLNTGYQKLVSDTVSGSVMITNLHNDVYGPAMEKPMQGPFTEYAVGGHQSRHVSINSGAADTYLTRPEAWKILLGTCTIPSGAIGMVGPDYPWPEANEDNYAGGVLPYPITGSQKAWLYRDYIAKRPVNIRNIRHATGSTVLGNYNENYDVVSTFGAHSNPIAFRDNQPTLPSTVLQYNATSSTTAETILGIRRTENNHFQFVAPYSVEYFSNGHRNKNVIKTRFGAPGGIETFAPAYNDFRSNEYSVYNTINYRNLTVRKPWQPPSGTLGPLVPLVSTPAGIHVYDIHGKDYGLTSQLSRHTARFGRDSLFVTSAGDLPGASYVQLPGFHKIHRNNITRIKRTDTLVNTMSKALTNSKSINYRVDQSKSGSALVLTGSGTFADQGAVLYQALTSSGFTYSGWLYFAPGSGVRRFFNMGRTQNGAFAGIQINKSFVSSQHRVNVDIAFANSDDSARGAAQWHVSGATAETWMHVAVTWTGSNGSLTSVDPKIYLNGTERTLTEDTAPPHAYYPQNWRVPATYKGFSNVVLSGDNMVIFGGNHSNTTWDFSGSMDEVSLWKRPLNAAEITEIYNGGVPCDITGSNTYASSSSDLWEWIRMGDGTGIQAINSSNPGVLAASNKITGVANGLLFMPISKTGSANPMTFNTTSPAVLTGCPSKIISTVDVPTFSTSSLYDNFFIKHQIPRMTKQYAWITSSVVDIKGRYGITPANFKISNSSGIVNAYDFVTSSDFGSFYNTSTNKRVFGNNALVVAGLAGQNQFIPVDFIGLNTNVVDELYTTTNTIGSSSTVSDYTNPSFIETINDLGSAGVLNSLLLHRHGPYGWPTWKQVRQNNNPLIRNQKRNNKLVVNIGSTSPNTFEMPPISLRGRTGIINFKDTTGATYSLKGSFTNEKIYFNTSLANDKLNISLVEGITPFEQAIKIGTSEDYGPKISWVKYSENIFPSQRNEFLSHSTQRLNYDNKFWRTKRTARQTVGSALSNSFGVYFNVAQNRHLSQSCFALDAPNDFLTRTRVPAFGLTSNSQAIRQANVLSEGAAGELQNTYSSYLSGAGSQAYGAGAVANRVQTLFPAALYARKQQLTTPTSVVCSSGIKIPETGSQAFSNSPFRAASQRDMSMAGEAVWEAGTQAGVVRKTGNNNISTFMISQSSPWYNDYTEFNADLKLKSQGYSTVPEFIISNHVTDYLETGVINNGKTDTFEIVGTDTNSSTVTNGTASFYIDYSNSDFLQQFMNIKNETLLNAKEIKLVCSAAIKFVPYKGFYPAERTLQLTNQFKNDYIDGLRGSCKGGSVGGSSLEKTATGNALLHLSGGMAKPLLQPLFAPGILYNTIKSGLAVDWPIVDSPTKFIKHFYGNPDTTDFKNASNWAITPRTGSTLYSPGMAGSGDNTEYARLNLNRNKTFFDRRLPFETIIYPEKYIRGVDLFDLDSHPSSSMLDTTASWDGSPGPAYSLMARNFFGGVASFYLEQSAFTRLESQPVRDDMEFSSGEVYMARLKIYRSMTGSRDYSLESGSYNYFGATGSAANRGAFTRYGASAVSQSSTSDQVLYIDGASYSLPQDPQKSNYRETFTMYSRPSAFGPDIAGISCGHYASASYYSSSVGGTIYDSFTGHNPAYTPPYYDGQSWVDFIFRPKGNTKYNLAKILSETTASYLRFDAGYVSGALRQSSSIGIGGPDSVAGASGERTPLIFTNNDLVNPSATVTIAPSTYPLISIYSGVNINKNSMQASASFNLFGVESVNLTEFDKFNNPLLSRNTTTAQKWIIEPKFETPMFNFNDLGVRQLTSSQISMPTFGSASVPRGMWHQFGIIEPDTDKGVFMEIGDMPASWLKYNHLVINTGSVYNQFDVEAGLQAANNVKSLSSLLGFNATGNKARLGSVKNELVVKEAVVAVPYIVESSTETSNSTTTNENSKQFISIPQERFEAALNNSIGSATGDSLEAAGSSIRRQIEKMNDYIMPPEFDFITNRALQPIAMYIFEFEFSFDQDDLAYMWQNLSPRNRKFSLDYSEVGHELLTTELLSESNLESNQYLRWMVFKVKQKSQSDYYDFVTTPAGTVPASFGKATEEADTGYNIAYNWPYDYMSFIERIKIDTEILYYSDEERSLSLTEETDSVADTSEGAIEEAAGTNVVSTVSATRTTSSPTTAVTEITRPGNSRNTTY